MVYVSPSIKGSRWFVCSEYCRDATSIKPGLWHRVNILKVPNKSWWCMHCWQCGNRLVHAPQCLLCDGDGCEQWRFDRTIDGGIWAQVVCHLTTAPVAEEMWDWAIGLYVIYQNAEEVERITVHENPNLDVPGEC